MRIKDRVAVVTGASSGIGRATALALAGRGCALVLTARRAEALQRVAEECSERGEQALVVPADVGDAEAVERVARHARDRFGRIDVWVNAAAVTVFGPFQDIPLEDFRRVIEVNLMGCVHGSRAALAVFREQGRGVLVNMSSVAGAIAQPYTAAYGMSKSAVRALSTSLRQELWLDDAVGIDVCTVLPAAIDTPLFRDAANYTGREVRAMPPVYTPERVASTILSLVRRPRREVVVGPMSRSLVMQSKCTPGFVEKLMAFQVNRSHLSRKHPAPATSGKLHEPLPGTGAIHGGWHGGRRTTMRRIATGTLLLGATAAAARRFSR
ncbi:SDR family oxidoreductase [Haloactinomyces albus]|uniref:Short-subunit dehydrogenase n=1 Tax=Haloactinomyces albus TaxID=1352928 RepID=A0AAE3ZAE8_9ACTN|nr:SDR family oxidoreductase [Haloactinomyces albus]MDR7300098.1 short-subunit dehydrogenase [Haloactinomyces albus]